MTISIEDLKTFFEENFEEVSEYNGGGAETEFIGFEANQLTKKDKIEYLINSIKWFVER